jgi:hypothetical protein
MHERPRIQEKGMELEIRRVEVEDKGQWTCRVWNSEGSIIRNFTLHIIGEFFGHEILRFEVLFTH